jgi:hypothetical protein
MTAWRGNPKAQNGPRPNQPLQRTPQAASEIGAFLKAGIGSTAFPI